MNGALRGTTNGKADITFVIVNGDGSPGPTFTYRSSLLTGVTFPSVDVASTAGGVVVLTFLPERLESGTGTVAGAKAPEQWLNGRFRVDIPGVDTRSVATLGAPTVTIPPIEATSGADVQNRVWKMGMPIVHGVNLTASPSDPAGFRGWFDEASKSPSTARRSASLVYLGRDGLEVARVGLADLFPASYTHSSFDASTGIVGSNVRMLTIPTRIDTT